MILSEFVHKSTPEGVMSVKDITPSGVLFDILTEIYRTNSKSICPLLTSARTQTTRSSSPTR